MVALPLKLHSSPSERQFNKSGNFSMSQGNLTLSNESEGGDIHRSQLCSIGRILFEKIKRQTDIGFPTRSIHSALYIHD